MPYKDPTKRKRVMRAANRKIHHGWDWRGIVDACGRVCAYFDDESHEDFCTGVIGLELHEPFGEVKHTHVDTQIQGKLQARVLLCKPCHSWEHNGAFSIHRGSVSMYLEDTDAEIEECGGLDAWRVKYRVGESFTAPANSGRAS